MERAAAGRVNVTAGHRRSLALLADAASVRVTLDMYRAEVGTDVYLRLTSDGLTVMSLDVDRCQSMIGIGTRGKRDDLLKSLPPAADAVRVAGAGYAAKRDSLGRGSIEERFALEQIAAALSNGLELGGTGWLFLHQEWRIVLPEGPGKVDLLAIDPAQRRLVVIECKASPAEVGALDSHGWTAAEQADAYSRAMWVARDEVYPFFGELVRAMAEIYAPDAELGSFDLDHSCPPTTAVWWPGHTPGWPAWDAAELRVESDTERVARYRRHQSWFREHHLGVRPGERPGSPSLRVGSTLDRADVAQRPGLNFLDDRALEHAHLRSSEVQDEGGTLEVDRLFHNLMSSMTMCFNIFGSIGSVDGFLDVVRRLFDVEATAVDAAVCEVKPTDSLRDRTAFDALIRYRAGDSEGRFVAIETKYTETFSKTVYDNDWYRSLTDQCGWFKPGAADRLRQSDTNQLWRGLMLAALTEAETGERGSYAVLAPADDEAAWAAVAIVADHLVDPMCLRFVPLEELVAAAAASADNALTSWAEGFATRYLVTEVAVPEAGAIVSTAVRGTRRSRQS